MLWSNLYHNTLLIFCDCLRPNIDAIFGRGLRTSRFSIPLWMVLKTPNQAPNQAALTELCRSNVGVASNVDVTSSVGVASNMGVASNVGVARQA